MDHKSPEQEVKNSAHEGSSCRLCSTELKHTFVNIGMSPLCQSFLKADQLDAMEPYYPINALVCDRCYLVQLREYVSPDSLFTDYGYFSSYSSSWLAHAKAYCEMMASRFDLGKDSLVVELASNDGYLLQYFQPKNIQVLGIEPSKRAAARAVEKEIPTVNEFFGTEIAEKLVKEGKKADVILGNNVLAHVPDLNGFVGGMVKLLKPEGVITLEFPYLARLMEENQFDTIFHEHFSYFSFVAIEFMAQKHQLKLIDVEELPTHGGSLRIYMTHASSSHQPASSVSQLLECEEKAGFRKLESYTSFKDQVEKTKRNILSFLIKAKEEGKTIVGYGAPGKGMTLLNYCGIGTDFLDFTVDRNTYKHGLFTPGMHIPVFPVEEIDKLKPDYVFILPWNLKEEISAQMEHIEEWGGKFVVPIPEIKVFTSADLKNS